MTDVLDLGVSVVVASQLTWPVNIPLVRNGWWVWLLVSQIFVLFLGYLAVEVAIWSSFVFTIIYFVNGDAVVIPMVGITIGGSLIKSPQSSFDVEDVPTDPLSWAEKEDWGLHFVKLVMSLGSAMVFRRHYPPRLHVTGWCEGGQ